MTPKSNTITRLFLINFYVLPMYSATMLHLYFPSLMGAYNMYMPPHVLSGQRAGLPVV